uniref:UDP-glycosyltransferase 75C1-like n=1 Tax=Erigeron canadensis TaxID=72917 RepID=UPI001CB8B7C2|nr:UDP-glycosyltransferase 75C1-like [Erigeron canadensis]
MTSHRKILIVAYPRQGMINPSIRLANRLIIMGAEVTFATSIFGIHRVNKEAIPHGLILAPFSDGHDNGVQQTTTRQQNFSDFSTNGASAITEILKSASAEGHPFDNLVYTIVVPWAAKVANVNGVKSTLLWCQPATVLDIYYYYFNGYESLISSNKNNPSYPINLPGLPPLTIADLPSFFLPSSKPNEQDFMLQILKDHIDVLKISPKVLVNTFDELEFESIRAIKKLEVLPVGPLIPLDGKGLLDNCIQWLNTKPKSSVVYVSFGTLGSFSLDQMEEIATGLLEIGRPFLWVIRDVEQAKGLSKIEELEKFGMIVNWCAQVLVLSHQAVGCFLMHGGWNSTIEALGAGVPTVVFPRSSDQGTIGKMFEDVWKTGVRVKKREGDEMVEGKEIKRCVELVMGDGEMKRNADKWRDLSIEALKDGGSSAINLNAFLTHA